MSCGRRGEGVSHRFVSFFPSSPCANLSSWPLLLAGAYYKWHGWTNKHTRAHAEVKVMLCIECQSAEGKNPPWSLIHIHYQSRTRPRLLILLLVQIQFSSLHRFPWIASDIRKKRQNKKLFNQPEWSGWTHITVSSLGLDVSICWNIFKNLYIPQHFNIISSQGIVNENFCFPFLVHTTRCFVLFCFLF